MVIFFHSKQSRDGQALLVLVLLIALVMTVITSVSYRLTTETQTTKSQEETVRALAAADSGIEIGIQSLNLPGVIPLRTFQDAGLILPGIDPNRSNILISSAIAPQFVSPEVTQDDQFTFYVSNYPDYTTAYTGPLAFYFGSDGAGSCGGSRSTPALELTIIYGATGNQVSKVLLERCTSGQFIAGPAGATKIQPAASSQTILGTAFSYNTAGNTINMGSYPNAKIILVRSLFAKTRIGVSTGGGGSLPIQGKTIRSEAVSNTGASKIVSLFQSFPQIPADFTVTSF